MKFIKCKQDAHNQTVKLKNNEKILKSSHYYY